jgi:HD-like signal output (HDOD) protein
MTANSYQVLERPLPNLDAWVRYLSQADIPVLKRTARELALLRENEENVSGRQVAAAILRDPLMALRVLAYIESHRGPAQTTDITTIDRAVMMMGITPFFKAFEALPLLEETLKSCPQALIGILRVVGRARNASLLARDWAIARHDLDVDEVTVAALLHDAAETLLWCFAPSLVIQVRALQDEERGLRSTAAQQTVLGIRVIDLQLALARDWRLPELLLSLMDDEHAANPRVRNVACAVSLARHSANGWDDPAIPDDLAAAADLLGISRDALMSRIARVLGTPIPLPPADAAGPPLA